ncbi:MAG: GxxExxY protein [Candidatus Falkowbacteria bacterium]
MEEKIIYKDLSYKINGLIFQVHKDLGIYRNEKQCSDYFEKLLIKNNIKYIREYRFIDQQYGNKQVRCVVDFIIEGKIVLEFKSKNFITNEDYYQTQRYLVTLNLRLGVLVNFRQYRVTPKRVINKHYREKIII